MPRPASLVATALGLGAAALVALAAAPQPAAAFPPVSYTHLTLPTKRIVKHSWGALLLT